MLAEETVPPLQVSSQGLHYLEMMHFVPFLLVQGNTKEVFDKILTPQNQLYSQKSDKVKKWSTTDTINMSRELLPLQNEPFVLLLQCAT
jgi:hypothetical protein